MKTLNFFESKKKSLFFSLLCGLAYLSIVSRFVLNNTNAGGGLLIMFFFPAIVCGAALFVFKLIDNYVKTESVVQLRVLVWGHIAVILLGIAMFAEMIIL